MGSTDKKGEFDKTVYWAERRKSEKMNSNRGRDQVVVVRRDGVVRSHDVDPVQRACIKRRIDDDEDSDVDEVTHKSRAYYPSLPPKKTTRRRLQSYRDYDSDYPERSPPRRQFSPYRRYEQSPLRRQQSSPVLERRYRIQSPPMEELEDLRKQRMDKRAVVDFNNPTYRPPKQQRIEQRSHSTLAPITPVKPKAKSVFQKFEAETHKIVCEMKEELDMIPPEECMHASWLLRNEIHKLENNIDPEWVQLNDSTTGKIITVVKKVLIPQMDQQHQINYVGRILGPAGKIIRDVSSRYKCRMEVLGSGSTRDLLKEKELLATGDPQYTHFSSPLHVKVETRGRPEEVFARIGGVIAELKQLLFPEVESDDQEEPVTQRLFYQRQSFPMSTTRQYRSTSVLPQQPQSRRNLTFTNNNTTSHEDSVTSESAGDGDDANNGAEFVEEQDVHPKHVAPATNNNNVGLGRFGKGKGGGGASRVIHHNNDVHPITSQAQQPPKQFFVDSTVPSRPKTDNPSPTVAKRLSASTASISSI